MDEVLKVLKGLGFQNDPSFQEILWLIAVFTRDCHWVTS
jgi:hypothetical protein